MEIPEHNLLSQRFALKMGFKKESIIENASKKNNQNINHIRFRLLKGEFING
jgi:RimJ/RimL family protein N-acetyltransferase